MIIYCGLERTSAPRHSTTALYTENNLVEAMSLYNDPLIVESFTICHHMGRVLHQNDRKNEL